MMDRQLEPLLYQRNVVDHLKQHEPEEYVGGGKRPATGSST